MRPRVQKLLRVGGDRVARLDRRSTAHAVILRAIRLAIPKRFDPEQARDLDATFVLEVRHPRAGEPARFLLRVADGRCEVLTGPGTDAGATATLGADDMIRLVSGAAAWPDLLSTRRLELAGDPFLALRFPALFRLPVS